MKNKKVKILLSILLIIFIVLFVIMLSSSLKSNNSHCSECEAKHIENEKEVTKIDLLKNMNMESYTYHDYSFTDMFVLSSPNLSEFQGYIINNNPNRQEDLNLKITLYDKNNKEIYSFKVDIYDIKFGEKRDFFSEITKDVSNVNSFKLEEY